MHQLLRISPRIQVLPIIHGSGDFAVEVRRVLLSERFDCLAVPLPPSFQEDVESAIQWLPAPTMVVQDNVGTYVSRWRPDDDEEDDDPTCSYVPIDPCQGVIAALRFALGERITRAFIDLETAQFEPHVETLPDPYALKTVALERFAGAVLTSLPRLPAGQPTDRVIHMAARLIDLEQRHESILLVCSIEQWPWIREAYTVRSSSSVEADPLPADEPVGETRTYEAHRDTLMFFFGEMPFITGLYERARSELEQDDNLSIGGVKELLLAARTSYREEFGNRAHKITPHTLSMCLKYIRNLTLMDRRMTPDLYSIVIAAKQMVGDGFALHVAETSREYPYRRDTGFGKVSLGLERGRMPDGRLLRLVSRLPGPPVVWRSCQLSPRVDKRQQQQWQMAWNPFSQCSWPPEDKLIENFRAHVADKAKAIIGSDLAKTEKFTTSIKDGIDIRDTLRNWHTGDLYVKVLPPSRGRLDCVVTLFDSPADPRDYPWRTTWFAEHQNESTLAFFATDFKSEMVGPGIGLGTYGGALFVFPPIAIPDIWQDPRLDFTETLEERLLAAACLHSACSNIALLASGPPGAGWRRLAHRFKKKWVHIPLGSFSDSTIQQLRMVHVLNGHHIRSFASHFIRRA